MPQESLIPDFALIGSTGISGHKTVVPECVTYPPEQTEHQLLPSMPNSIPEPASTYLGTTAGDTLLLQLQGYDRAFEDWLSLNPS